MCIRDRLCTGDSPKLTPCNKLDRVRHSPVNRCSRLRSWTYRKAEDPRKSMKGQKGRGGNGMGCRKKEGRGRKEKNRQQQQMRPVRMQSSAKYDGARPCMHLNTVIASLKIIRWRTASQYKSRNTWAPNARMGAKKESVARCSVARIRLTLIWMVNIFFNECLTTAKTLLSMNNEGHLYC